MNSTTSQILRLILGTASVVLAANDSQYWWVAVFPWMLICILGIIATIPILFIVGIGAGATQVDWMSDEFIWGLVLVTPTVLSVTIAHIFKHWLKSSSSDGPAHEHVLVSRGGFI
jgi:ABC-type uncharacterized transport system permease subunit